MKFFKLLIIVMILLSISINTKAETPIVFIDKYKNKAIELMCSHNIPASIILGISIHESAYGTSKLSKTNKNFFGIKRTSNYYRIYENDTDSFEDFCKLISNKKYYIFLTSNNIVDYKEWLNKIQSAGYAEDLEWKNKVESHIKKYKLYELDNFDVTCN